MAARRGFFAGVRAVEGVDEKIDGIEDEVEGNAEVDQMSHDLTRAEEPVVENEEGELGEKHCGPVECACYIEGLRDCQLCSYEVVIGFSEYTSRRDLVSLEIGKFQTWTV